MSTPPGKPGDDRSRLDPRELEWLDAFDTDPSPLERPARPAPPDSAADRQEAAQATAPPADAAEPALLETPPAVGKVVREQPVAEAAPTVEEAVLDRRERAETLADPAEREPEPAVESAQTATGPAEGPPAGSARPIQPPVWPSALATGSEPEHVESPPAVEPSVWTSEPAAASPGRQSAADSRPSERPVWPSADRPLQAEPTAAGASGLFTRGPDGPVWPSSIAPEPPPVSFTPPEPPPAASIVREPAAPASSISRDPSPPPRKIPAARASRQAARSDAVSLADVHLRQVPVQWPEAVAIVAELCAVLGDDAPVPDHSRILLTSSGDVVVVPGGRPQREAGALGRMLHGLLATGTPPAPLRLFVSQAISSSQYPTAGAFGDALAYYERPGRAEMIRAVYERCQTRPAPLVAPEPDAEEEIDEEEAPAPQPGKPPDSLMRVAVAAVLVAGLAAAGVWYWMTPADSAADYAEVGPPVEEGAEAEAGGTGASEGENSGSQAAATRGSGSPSTASRSRLRAGANGRLRGAVRPMVTPATPAELLAAEAAAAADATLVGGADAIFTSADQDVIPPVLLYSQLPEPAPPGSPSIITNRMEVLVSEKGTVERVRLITDPRRMTDMMLLSGAKTWRFQPATKGGRPVRYRAVVTWTVTPP